MSLLLSANIYGQVDSINFLVSTDSVLQSKLKHHTDSLNHLASLQWVKDSLTITAWSNSLKAKVESNFGLDSIRLTSKIDSLKDLRLSTDPYSSNLDSLLQSRQNKLAEITEKQNELTGKAKGKISKWQQSVRSRLDSLRVKGNLPGNLKSPAIPGENELTIPAVDLPEIPSLSTGDFTELSLSPDLSKLNAELPFVSIDGLNGIQDNLSGISDRASFIGELKDNAPQAIESAIGNVDAMTELKKQTNALEALQATTNPMDQVSGLNPDQLKADAVEKTVNHFAGKEEPLSQAMERVSQFKQHYSNVQSLKDLPKKPPNPMKGKPFIERLLPGLGIQIQRKNDYWFDFNPYVGYRFNGRITSGIGWNQRIAFNADERSFVSQSKIYGPRLFGEYNLWKGFCPRGEIEVMNAWIPPLTKNPQPDMSTNEWVWSYFAGLKKSYNISNGINGTAMVMFNLYNPHYKSPYVDRVNMRIGFEFPLKKKQK